MIYKINNEPNIFLFGTGDIILTVGKNVKKEPLLFFETRKAHKIGRIKTKMKMIKSKIHTIFQFEKVESIDAVINALKEVRKLKLKQNKP